VRGLSPLSSAIEPNVSYRALPKTQLFSYEQIAGSLSIASATALNFDSLPTGTFADGGT
jgi:hypothetical protein